MSERFKPESVGEKKEGTTREKKLAERSGSKESLKEEKEVYFEIIDEIKGLIEEAESPNDLEQIRKRIQELSGEIGKKAEKMIGETEYTMEDLKDVSVFSVGEEKQNPYGETKGGRFLNKLFRTKHESIFKSARSSQDDAEEAKENFIEHSKNLFEISHPYLVRYADGGQEFKGALRLQEEIMIDYRIKERGGELSFGWRIDDRASRPVTLVIKDSEHRPIGIIKIDKPEGVMQIDKEVFEKLFPEDEKKHKEGIYLSFLA